MKNAILVFLLCLTPFILLADFQRDVPIERIQPDGTKISLLATGDEFYGTVRDSNNFTAMLNPASGYYEYAVKEAGKLIPSGKAVGSYDPSALGVEPFLNEDEDIVKEKVRENKSAVTLQTPGVNTRSTWNNLIIYVSFYTNPANNFLLTYQEFDNRFNDNSNSVKSFFLEESDGQESLTTYQYVAQMTYPIDYIYYANGHDIGYYQPYSSTNTIGYPNFTEGWNRLIDFLDDIVLYMADEHPQNMDTFDSDNDGFVDNVTFIALGGQDSPGNLLFPRSGVFPPGVQWNNKQAKNFNLTFEHSSQGAVCHEISHSIGFPDLYRSGSYVTDYHPAGLWDVMDQHSPTPAHSLVYMKYKYGGWCTQPPPLNLGSLNTLDAISIDPFAAGRIVSGDPDETYYFEFRKNTGVFEQNLPGSGLIVYRVNSDADGEGNYDGPPDEVYVYRPGGTLTNNGDPDNAFFSSQAGRTTFNSTTDPSPTLSNGEYGGLTVWNIGSSAGTGISFNATVINNWTGAVSTNWHNAGNWLFGVPDENASCTIPGGLTRYPLISTTANCKSMTIHSGAYIIVDATLIVHDNLNSNGTVNIVNTNSIDIYGNANWKSGSSVVMSNNNCQIQTRGSATFEMGNNIHSTTGQWMFSDSASNPNSTLHIHGDAEINILYSYKSYPNYLLIEGTAGKVLTINNGVYVPSGKYIKTDDYAILDIKGNLSITSGGYFHGTGGTVRFSSTTNRNITMNNSFGNYFNSLEVAMQNNSTLTLNTATQIYGDLSISSGYLNPNNNTIYMLGDWTNTAGEGHFVAGTGIVNFWGQQSSTVMNEHFNTVVNVKYETEQLIIPTGSTVRIASYDWTDGVLRVNGGYLGIDDLADTNITGYWRVDSGVADVRQDAANNVNLAGSLTVNSGELNFIYEGAPNTSTWTAGSIVMSGGVIDFTNSSISIPSGGTYFNFTGGTVRTQYNLSLTRGGVNLQNSTFEMYGSPDAIITQGTTTNSYFGNIIINKASRNSNANLLSKIHNELVDESGHQTLRANTVTSGSSLNILGLLNVTSGTFNVNGFGVTAYGGIVVSGHVQMSAGTLDSYTADFLWNSGSTTNITGGNIKCEGNWAFNEGSHAHLDALSITLENDGGDKTITSCSSDSWFGNLTISMYTDYEINYDLSTNSTVPLQVRGNLYINEMVALNLGTKAVTVNGDVSLTNGSKLKLGKGAIFSMASGKSLTVNSGCTLEAIGVQDTLATFTHQTGNYNITIAGTIKAQYALFEYIGTNGVNIQSGAIVDNIYSLNYCTFRNGVAPGTLLTINNNQVFTAYSANFPTWAGTGSYNARKTVNVGTVTFGNALGSYAGGGYENDPNGRIFWTTTNCELSVLSYNGTPNPQYVCEPITLSATVRNNSINPVTVPIRVDVYFNRTSLPAASEAGDMFGYLNPIGANASATYTFPTTSSEEVTNWQTWFRVDRLNEIAETNETNNGGGPLAINWNPLPPVQIETIYYEPFSQMIIFTWAAYPLSVEGFNIYRSADPTGPFTELAGSTTNNFYSEFEAGPKYFYKVRAIKNWP